MRSEDFETKESLDRYLSELENECKTYRDAAALYGVDAMTMLALAKSQIKTVADNIRMREVLDQYEIVFRYLKRLFSYEDRDSFIDELSEILGALPEDI